MEKENQSKNQKLNPNGVNQYTAPDPRQQKCLALYLDPESKTYANLYQSSIKAGYTHEYAKNLSSIMPKWLSESVGNVEMIKMAEKNLKEFLQNKDDNAYRWKASEFTLERLAKKKYGKNIDITTKGNKINSLRELSDEELESIISEKRASKERTGKEEA